MGFRSDGHLTRLTHVISMVRALVLVLSLLLTHSSSAHRIIASSDHISEPNHEKDFQGEDTGGLTNLQHEQFDWTAYRDYNPDLPPEIQNARQSSWDHYVQHGHRESRLAFALRIVLRYDVQQGFSNQLYCHIPALALAATLGAEVVLAPALMRSSFAHFELGETRSGWQATNWTSAPLDQIIDVEKLQRFWAGEGLTLHQV